MSHGELTKETRRAFQATCSCMLREFARTWPEDEDIRSAKQQWREKIERAGTDMLRRTRLDVIAAIMAEQIDDELLLQLNERNMAFFDLLEARARDGARGKARSHACAHVTTCRARSTARSAGSAWT